MERTKPRSHATRTSNLTMKPLTPPDRRCRYPFVMRQRTRFIPSRRPFAYRRRSSTC